MALRAGCSLSLETASKGRFLRRWTTSVPFGAACASVRDRAVSSLMSRVPFASTMVRCSCIASRELYLADNDFTGTVPTSVAELASVRQWCAARRCVEPMPGSSVLLLLLLLLSTFHVTCASCPCATGVFAWTGIASRSR